MVTSMYDDVKRVRFLDNIEDAGYKKQSQDSTGFG